MTAERFRLKYLVSPLACALFAFIPLVGCAETQTYKSSLPTSYISTDSTVYSTVAEVVTDVADSVVEIRTETVKVQGGYRRVISGAGSGVIVALDKDSSEYYIITNNHVISGAQQISIALRNGDSYVGTLVATDEAADIAVVTIEEERSLNLAIWGDSSQLQIGEDMIAIGNPLGALGGTVTKGILSAKQRSIPVGNYTMELLQTDTAINPGNSGGGLFNMRGELIGIVNAKTSDEEIEGICFAIPANTARKVYDDLVRYGVVQGRATFGISVVESESNFVYVTDVAGAESGTFSVYDKIEEINGVAVSSLLTYNDALASIELDENGEKEVTVAVRHGRIQQVSGIFGSYSTLLFDDEKTTFAVTAKQVQKLS